MTEQGQTPSKGAQGLVAPPPRWPATPTRRAPHAGAKAAPPEQQLGKMKGTAAKSGSTQTEIQWNLTGRIRIVFFTC